MASKELLLWKVQNNSASSQKTNFVLLSLEQNSDVFSSKEKRGSLRSLTSCWKTCSITIGIVSMTMIRDEIANERGKVKEEEGEKRWSWKTTLR